jgi:N-acetylmuramoyl-L-alanine amidase/Putative peptidoglycan binding domain
MTLSLAWLPDALMRAGLKVALVDDWDIRGRGDVGQTLGVLCHHTAGPRNGNMPSLDTLIHGRPDLNGPLAQLGLGRDGTYYVIAAGRCNHAGAGVWQGITTGNTNFIGIEAENTGQTNDAPWPAIQIEAYQRGVAAILKHAGLGAERCAGHKEFAPNRKTDPTLDMVAFRASVSAILAGTAPQLTPIPAVEPPTQAGGVPGRPTLRRGSAGDLVRIVQQKLSIVVDGVFGGGTEAAVRVLQREHRMVPDGIVGPKTWTTLDAM